MNNEGGKMAQKAEKGREKVEIIGVYIGGKPDSDYFGGDEKRKKGKSEFGLGKFFKNIAKAISGFVSEEKRKRRREAKKKAIEKKEPRRREIERLKKPEEAVSKVLGTTEEGKIEVLIRADRKKTEAEAAEWKKEEKHGIIEVAKEVLMEKSEEAKAKKAAVEKLRKERIEERERQRAEERARIEAERKEFLKRMEKEERKEKPWPTKSVSPEPVTIVRTLPKKPSFKERLGIRIAILILLFMVLFGIATFWYWFLKKRGGSPPLPPFPQQETSKSLFTC